MLKRVLSRVSIREPYYLPLCRITARATSCNFIDAELKEIRAAGTYKGERIITSSQGSQISVKGRQTSVLNFCANNYLGLSSHPEVIAAAKNAIDTHGAGLSSVRFICGTQDIHKDLEQKLARFHGKEDAILYACCYEANTGLFETLLSQNDAVISDELNHASIIDGIRLSRAQRYRYSHCNMSELENKLRETQSARLRLIASDGVFSMDGSVTPLKDICFLAEKYNALVFLDECHATGFFGKTGRGTEEHFELRDKVDIINSTLGKALGGAAGGYTTGPKQLTELLRNRSRPYLYSNALPPPVVASSSKALDLITASSQLISKVAANTKLFRSRMQEAGFKVSGDKDHPICPVMLKDARLAAEFAERMLDKNIFVVGFSYPVVPKDTARIRVQLSAAHSQDDVNKAVDAFIDIGRELKVIA